MKSPRTGRSWGSNAISCHAGHTQINQWHYLSCRDRQRSFGLPAVHFLTGLQCLADSEQDGWENYVRTVPNSTTNSLSETKVLTERYTCSLATLCSKEQTLSFILVMKPSLFFLNQESMLYTYAVNRSQSKPSTPSFAGNLKLYIRRSGNGAKLLAKWFNGTCTIKLTCAYSAVSTALCVTSEGSRAMQVAGGGAQYIAVAKAAQVCEAGCAAVFAVVCPRSRRNGGRR